MRHIRLALLLSALASPALAQSPVSGLKAHLAETFQGATPSGSAAVARNIRVQSNVNYFVQGTSGSTEDALAAQTRARQQFYVQAGKECDVLLQTIAATCRLEQINVNINNQRFNQHQPDGFTLNGSMSFSITPK